MATSILPPKACRPYAPADPSFADLDDAEVSESLEQDRIIEVTRWSLKALARLRGWNAVYIGHHNFFAWKKGDPKARLAPDLYLVDDPPTAPEFVSWQVGTPGFRPPRWALEVVSEDWRKDYLDNPPKYAELGCSELVVFDPLLLRDRPADGRDLRNPLTIFRLVKGGKLRRFYSGQGPAFSQVLSVWLATERQGYQSMIRLCLDKAGKKVVPTEDEERREQAVRADEAELRAYQNQAERDRMAHEIDKQKLRAEEQKLRADEQKLRAERMAERMRRAGLDPDDDS